METYSLWRYMFMSVVRISVQSGRGSLCYAVWEQAAYFKHKCLKTLQVVPFIHKLYQQRSLLQTVERYK